MQPSRIEPMPMKKVTDESRGLTRSSVEFQASWDDDTRASWALGWIFATHGEFPIFVYDSNHKSNGVRVYPKTYCICIGNSSLSGFEADQLSHALALAHAAFECGLNSSYCKND